MADASAYNRAGNAELQHATPGGHSVSFNGVAINGIGDNLTLTAKIDEAERNRLICQLTGGRGIEIDKATGKVPPPAQKAGTLTGLKAQQARALNTIVVGASPDGKTWDPWKENKEDKAKSMATARALAEMPIEKSIPVANLKTSKPRYTMDGMHSNPSPFGPMP